MTGIKASTLKDASPYNAVITREQFLFFEMRTTAKLKSNSLSDKEVADCIVADNLFQYPTEKTVRRMALTCIRRLNAMNDTTLVQAIATQTSDVAKQICLYAMMKQYSGISFSTVLIAVVTPWQKSWFVYKDLLSFVKSKIQEFWVGEKGCTKSSRFASQN